MAYTPENNPYIPGDPYSYDLKWLVAKIKELGINVSALEAKLSKLTGGGAYNFANVQALIDSDAENDALAYVAGFYDAGDGGACWYYITTDPSAIIGQPFYVTLAGGTKWAIPVIVTPYVTPEMFGAYADGVHDDKDAIETALNSGAAVVIFNRKTYLSSDTISITETTWKKIQGASATASILKFESGGLVIADAITNFTISDMRIIGAGSGSGIKGRLYQCELERLRITGFDKGIEVTTSNWCGFNTYRELMISDCTYGFSVLASNGYNDNAFYDCIFQDCDAGFYGANMRANAFYNCDFEGNVDAISLGSTDNTLFDGCYFESNTTILHQRGAYFGASVTFRNSYIYNATFTSGWFVTLRTLNTISAARAVISLEHNTFKNWVASNDKPFAFTDEGSAGTYGYINISGTVFEAITGLPPAYMDLFDTTNYANYGYNSGNFAPIETDLVFENVSNIDFFRRGAGNASSTNEKTGVYKAIGKYEVTSTGNSTVSIPVNRRVTPYDTCQCAVLVHYTDNSDEMRRVTVQNNLFQVYVDSAKTTSYILVNTEYKVN